MLCLSDNCVPNFLCNSFGIHPLKKKNFLKLKLKIRMRYIYHVMYQFRVEFPRGVKLNSVA
jgi:hypothetical protein